MREKIEALKDEADPAAQFVQLGGTHLRVNVLAFELNRAAAADAGRVADDGVRVALEAGLRAEPLAVEATGAVWKTIVEIADRHDAAAIVMGSRGLTDWGSMLLGSVSSPVVQHADRPTLVIRQPVAAA